MLRSLPSLPALGMGPSLEDRAHSPLPPMGHDISRPSSTSTQNSNVLRHHQQQQHQQQQGQQGQQQGHNNGVVNLPGMSALASVASAQSPQMRSFSSVNQGLNYATASPTPTSVGGNSPPVCQNCQTSTTPLWRRDELGSVLCNACGLFLKLHGRPRPISLKTDVIKSRNRVKSSGQAIKKAAKALLNGSSSRSEAGTPPPGLRRVSQKSGSDRSNSPISRTTTPALHHPSAIAPQHMFDTSHLPDHHHLSHSPSLPALHFRHPSPGGSVVSTGDRHLEPPQTYENLMQANTQLKTRVSELEVINGLYKGRVQDLERADAMNRQALDQSRAREDDLQRRLEELEHHVADLRRDSPNYNSAKRRLDGDIAKAPELSPQPKRTRLSDVAQYPDPPQPRRVS